MEKPVFIFENAEGVKYKIYYGKPKFSYKKNGKINTIRVMGVCDSPELKNPKIIIDDGLKEKAELATLIEECCHAFFWDKKEKEVRPFSKSLTKLLYKQGWRKTK